MFYGLGAVQVSVMPYLVGILMAFVACVLAFTIAALIDSNQDTWLVRLTQRLRLGRTRMSGMLKRRHVDIADYLNTLSLADLREQIATCQGCGLFGLCDRALAGRTSVNSHSQFSFCPNRPAIERYRFAKMPRPG